MYALRRRSERRQEVFLKDGFVMFMVFLAIFVAGFNITARTGMERAAFDDAGIKARSFLHTVCRMGEISDASYSSFINALPKTDGVFDVKIRSGSGNDLRPADGEPVLLEPGEEIDVELRLGERSFVCRGRVNGLRR